MARPSDRDVIVRLRQQLQAQESTRRLALMAAVDLQEGLTHLAMAAPVTAMIEIGPALQAAQRLVRLLSGEEVDHG